MIALVVTVVIDISIVKVYDLIDKSFIPDQTKFLLFFINTSVCIALEFIVIKYLYDSFKRYRWKKVLSVNLLYRISFISLLIIGALMALLMFQQFYDNYYQVSLSILIVLISYVLSASFIIVLSILFLSWYKSHHN
jgi:membrane-associated PAP2 superfamily phosphatase